MSTRKPYVCSTTDDVSGSKPLRRSSRLASLFRKSKPNSEPVMLDLISNEQDESGDDHLNETEIVHGQHEEHPGSGNDEDDVSQDNDEGNSKDLDMEEEEEEQDDGSDEDITVSPDHGRRKKNAKTSVEGDDETSSEDSDMEEEGQEDESDEGIRASPDQNRRKKKVKRYVEGDVCMLRTRTSPKPLLSVFESLTMRQRDAIREMGFGRILLMKIDEIPSAIAFHVVNQLDTRNMCIRNNNADIHISRRSVHEVLGFPLGNIAIIDEQRFRYKHPISEMWKRHMGLKGGCIRSTHVANKIIKNDDDDWVFRIDFLVLLVSSLVGGTKFGTVNQRFIPSITADRDIKNLDWCGYVLNAIRRCKSGWVPNDKNSFFIGPITFLVLLYCDAVLCNVPVVPRLRPVIAFWRLDELKQRQKYELLNGGFGRLGLRVETVSTQEEVCDSHNQIGPEPTQYDSDDRCGCSHEIDNDEDADRADECIVKDVCDEVSQFLHNIEQSKPMLELALMRCIERYGGNTRLCDLKSRWFSIFGADKASQINLNEHNDVTFRHSHGATPMREVNDPELGSSVAGRRLSFSPVRSTGNEHNAAEAHLIQQHDVL